MFDSARARGARSTYLVIPPGGGKTLIGLEAARRLGHPTLVLCPNIAIQAQWIAQWSSLFGAALTATVSTELPTPLTVLTYQSVSTLETAISDRRSSDERLLEALHPNGRKLLARLTVGGPLTLVLDECHHLLEIWGRLLRAIVTRLDDPHIIGLTATPPQLMTADQAVLHRELFGTVDLEVSTPALVRSGRLAPFQELAYFCAPTAYEADYIAAEALRFAELRSDLLDQEFGATPFLTWLDRRVVERRTGPDGTGAQVSWERFAREEPAVADAALRLHADGLLALPVGARLREQHRHPPTAQDWAALVGDYCKHCLLPGVDAGDPRDQAAYEAIRRALPSVGYRLTRVGVRAGETPAARAGRRAGTFPQSPGFSPRAGAAASSAPARCSVRGGTPRPST